VPQLAPLSGRGAGGGAEPPSCEEAHKGLLPGSLATGFACVTRTASAAGLTQSHWAAGSPGHTPTRTMSNLTNHCSAPFLPPTDRWPSRV